MEVITDAFENAKLEALAREPLGIGTLGEKTLHAVLKNYYCPPNAMSEVKIGRYWADIFDGQAVTEIQTRGFNALRDKLSFFLPQYPVKIIYPIASVKWLIWINEDDGSVTKRRRSPKRGTQYMAFSELYKIKQHLTNPNLSIRIALMELEEYRTLNGWSADRKRGSTRYDRLPTSIIEEVDVESPEDWQKFIPPILEGQFTSSDFKAAAKITRGDAQTALNVLTYVGAVRRIGKAGNAIVYEREASLRSELTINR